MKKILIIDNYDSFTYNLVQYLEEHSDVEVNVIKNDDPEIYSLLKYSGIVISPGPGLPGESGLLSTIFDDVDRLPPTLGICLGLQAIGEAFGGKLKQLDKVFHGVDSEINVTDENEVLFEDMDKRFKAGRYHSWVINPDSIAECPLEVTCMDDAGNIMGIRHKILNIRGVQFHPESVMTPEGRKIISNFLNNCTAA